MWIQQLISWIVLKKKFGHQESREMSDNSHSLLGKEAMEKVSSRSESSQPPIDIETGSTQLQGGDEALLEQIGYKQVC
jgi:hypothetical protein